MYVQSAGTYGSGTDVRACVRARASVCYILIFFNNMTSS